MQKTIITTNARSNYCGWCCNSQEYAAESRVSAELRNDMHQIILPIATIIQIKEWPEQFLLHILRRYICLRRWFILWTCSSRWWWTFLNFQGIFSDINGIGIPSSSSNYQVTDRWMRYRWVAPLNLLHRKVNDIMRWFEREMRTRLLQFFFRFVGVTITNIMAIPSTNFNLRNATLDCGW